MRSRNLLALQTLKNANSYHHARECGKVFAFAVCILFSYGNFFKSFYLGYQV